LLFDENFVPSTERHAGENGNLTINFAWPKKHQLICTAFHVVRLYGGDRQLNGLVQFISFAHSNPDAREWNYVCDDGWDINAAKVVCRQLGLGPPIRTDPAQPLPDDGLVHRYVMDNVNCEGTEQYLSDCPHLFDGYNFTMSDCIGSEAVSVTCGGKSVQFSE